ncbi:MAG: hypothetical protein WB785_16355 [Mycobacterium sp.]|uniref:hypothetical protein n=1 Tax=Mycobacterium sp. TaxID=1785 RepID=UPI003C650C5A
MLNTVNGLPAHPLLAHVVAIFIPLTALLTIAIVVWWALHTSLFADEVALSPVARRGAVVVAGAATLPFAVVDMSVVQIAHTGAHASGAASPAADDGILRPRIGVLTCGT